MKSEKLLESFVAHCKANPTERFWQALRNWSGIPFIFAWTRLPYTEEIEQDEDDRMAPNRIVQDTFYWTDKNQLDH